MKILSFDNSDNNRIKRDPSQGNLFDLFQKNIVNTKNISLEIYIVPREFEMRLDRISYYIYGSSNYVEELMVLNDIINPYSIQEGQYIYFCDVDNLNLLYTTDDMMTNDVLRQQIINSSSQQNTNNPNNNLPITIKPSNLQQLKVDSNNGVTIMNSYE